MSDTIFIRILYVVLCGTPGPLNCPLLKRVAETSKACFADHSVGGNGKTVAPGDDEEEQPERSLVSIGSRGKHEMQHLFFKGVDFIPSSDQFVTFAP